MSAQGFKLNRWPAALAGLSVLLTACLSTTDPLAAYLGYDFTGKQGSPLSAHCTVLRVEVGPQAGELNTATDQWTSLQHPYIVDTRFAGPVTARCFEYVVQADGQRVKTETGRTVIGVSRRVSGTVDVGSSEGVPASVTNAFKAQSDITTTGLFPILQVR